MWFLAPLLTAIGAVCIYNKLERMSEELAIACVAIALACIVLTLFVAPWPIQLLLVVVLLGSRFIRSSGILGH